MSINKSVVFKEYDKYVDMSDVTATCRLLSLSIPNTVVDTPSVTQIQNTTSSRSGYYDRLEKNKKYFATVKTPIFFQGPSDLLSLRFIVLNIKKNYFTNYITLQVLESSKDNLSECGRNPVTIPEHWIMQPISLHTLFDKLLIDDIIYLIDSYI